MSDQAALIHLGELSKPATVLVEKISAGIGGLLAPWLTVREARAEVAASKIRALGAIEISQLEEHALRNAIARELREQENILAIVANALPDVAPDADPSRMDEDWISQFFHIFRRTTNEEMQALWGRVLATETNRPQSFSKRTLHVMSVLERQDAELFGILCRFCIVYKDQVFPLIFNSDALFYTSCGLAGHRLSDLEDLDLISISMESLIRVDDVQVAELSYFGEPIRVTTHGKKALQAGRISLTRAGTELFRVSGAEPVPGFADFVLPSISPTPKQKA